MDSAATDDRYVSTLEVLADENSGREVIVEIIPELFSGAWRLLSYEVLGVHRKFGRCLVFCRISYRDGKDRRTHPAELVAKPYKSHKSNRGARALRALQLLREVGFQPPSRYLVPRPYGYSSKHNILVQEKISGTQWADFLGSDERDVSVPSEQAADWLVRLQGSTVVVGEDRSEDVALPRRMARELIAAYPQCAPLEPVAGWLAKSLNSEGASLVLSHGDYHPKNIFLGPGYTAVIDLDHLGQREPAFDVGYAIGQLLIMSYFRMGGFAPGAHAALSFWRRYEHGGAAEWSRVAAHVARTFLQSLHYELCVIKNGRVELIPVWTHLIEEFLGSKGPETLEDLIRHS